MNRSISNRYGRHHAISGRADNRDAVRAGVGYIDAAAVGSDGRVNGIGAYRYGGNDAIGYCVDDGDRVGASVGYVGGGPIGSDGRVSAPVAELIVYPETLLSELFAT